MTRIEIQRRALHDRMVRDRRQAVTNWLRENRERRSGLDRRDPTQRQRDNEYVSGWMETFTNARNGAHA